MLALCYHFSFACWKCFARKTFCACAGALCPCMCGTSSGEFLIYLRASNNSRARESVNRDVFFAAAVAGLRRLEYRGIWLCDLRRHGEWLTLFLRTVMHSALFLCLFKLHRWWRLPRQVVQLLGATRPAYEGSDVLSFGVESTNATSRNTAIITHCHNGETRHRCLRLRI